MTSIKVDPPEQIEAFLREQVEAHHLKGAAEYLIGLVEAEKKRIETENTQFKLTAEQVAELDHRRQALEAGDMPLIPLNQALDFLAV